MLTYTLGGGCRPILQILTLFQTPKDISYTLLLIRGRSTYLHFGWGVPPSPSNPDPISDSKRHFIHSIVNQGEECLPTLWVEVRRPSLQILTLFQTPKDISYTPLLPGEEYLPTLWVGVYRPILQILILFQTRKDISYTLLLVRGRSTYLHFGWGCDAQALKS